MHGVLWRTARCRARRRESWVGRLQPLRHRQPRVLGHRGDPRAPRSSPSSSRRHGRPRRRRPRRAACPRPRPRAVSPGPSPPFMSPSPDARAPPPIDLTTVCRTTWTTTTRRMCRVPGAGRRGLPRLESACPTKRLVDLLGQKNGARRVIHLAACKERGRQQHPLPERSTPSQPAQLHSTTPLPPPSPFQLFRDPTLSLFLTTAGRPSPTTAKSTMRRRPCSRH